MSQISPAEVWILKYIHVNQMRKRMRKTHLLLNYLKCFNTKLWELKWESTFKYWIKWLKKKKKRQNWSEDRCRQPKSLCEWVRVLAKVSAKDDTEIEELGGFSHPHLVCHFYIPESRLVGPAPPHSSRLPTRHFPTTVFLFLIYTANCTRLHLQANREPPFHTDQSSNEFSHLLK